MLLINSSVVLILLIALSIFAFLLYCYIRKDVKVNDKLLSMNTDLHDKLVIQRDSYRLYDNTIIQRRKADIPNKIEEPEKKKVMSEKERYKI